MRDLRLLLLLSLTACTIKGGLPIDLDRDGYGRDVDCDDANDEIHPHQAEVCDGVDNDCDGLIDAEDDSSNTEIWATDQDRDGHGDPSTAARACTAPPGGVTLIDDCDDEDPHAYAGAKELWYDGIDQNCDGASDYDQDQDGHDNAGFGGDDCDDLNATTYPGAEEIWYDGIDQDCDRASDYDQDADGYDSDAYGAGDCDDSDPMVHPSASEVWYDGVDQDCDGASDYDADADGYDSSSYSGEDCDDKDPTISPGTPETWYDGIDVNCDPSDEYDADADGFDSEDWGGEDCDDTLSSVFPGADEVWYDGIDQDCDGGSDYDQDGDGYDSASSGGDDCDDSDAELDAADRDLDGWSTCDGDCDDDDASRSPSEPEIPDGIDNDCSGVVDDTTLELSLSTWADFSEGLLDGHALLSSTSDGELALSPLVSSLDEPLSGQALPIGLSNFGSVATGGYIYAMGGATGTGTSAAYSSAVYSAALESDGSISDWTALSSLDTARAGLSLSTDGRCLVLAGGHNSSSTTNDVFTASLNGDGTIGLWAEQASLPGARTYAGAVVSRGFVYIMAGYNSGSAYNTVYYARIDPDCGIDTWNTTTALPASRYHVSAVSAGGTLYVLGGHYYYGQSSVWSAVPESDGSITSWTTESSMPEGLHGQASVALGGKLFTMGGNNETDPTISTVYEASVDSSGHLSDWSESSISLDFPRAYFGLHAWNGQVYVVGGGVGDLTSGTALSDRMEEVELISADTSSTWAWDSRYLATVDFGADTALAFLDWTAVTGTGELDVSYRVADDATSAAGSWTALGSSGRSWIVEDARYLQLDLHLSSDATSAFSLEELVIGYR